MKMWLLRYCILSVLHFWHRVCVFTAVHMICLYVKFSRERISKLLSWKNFIKQNRVQINIDRTTCISIVQYNGSNTYHMKKIYIYTEIAIRPTNYYDHYICNCVYHVFYAIWFIPFPSNLFRWEHNTIYPPAYLHAVALWIKCIGWLLIVSQAHRVIRA